jgi:hypothetical protein
VLGLNFEKSHCLQSFTKVVQDYREAVTKLFQVVSQQQKGIKTLTDKVQALEKQNS